MDGEQPQRTIGEPQASFTLTNQTLYVWRLVAQDTSAGGATVSRSTCTRLDMRQMFARGLVDWDVVQDVAYFLTRDSHLLSLPLNEVDPHFSETRVDFAAEQLGPDRMVAHKGLLFIAPLADGIVVYRLQPTLNSTVVEMDVSNPAAKLFLRNGRLYFGVPGQKEAELLMEGDSIDEIDAVQVLDSGG